MTAISWKGGNGTWNTAADWSGGVVPGAADDVTIAAAGTYTVTIGGNVAAHSLTLADATAKVNDTGTLSLGGSLAITAGTFTLAAGGEVLGGTVSTAGTGSAFLSTGGTLSGATYLGTLDVSEANAAVSLAGDTFLGAAGSGTGTIADTGSNATVVLLGSQTLNNVQIEIGNGSGASTLALAGTSASATLTLGAQASLTQAGKNATLNVDTTGTGNTVINNGTITTSGAGGQFLVVGQYSADTLTNNALIAVSGNDTFDTTGIRTFANAGTLTAAGGSTTVKIGPGWSDTGLITASGGAAIFLDGAYTNSTGGTVTATGAGTAVQVNGAFAQTGQLNVASNATVRLTGQITDATIAAVNNTGGTVTVSGVLNNAGGVFAASKALNLSGGTIQGGTVTDASGLLNTAGGTLSGVAFDGTLTANATNEITTITGTDSFAGAAGTGTANININGAGSELNFLDTGTLDNATLNLGAGSNAYIALSEDNAAVDTLTLGAHLLVQVGTRAAIYADNNQGFAGQIVNQGTIADATSGTLLLTGFATTDGFANQGTIAISNGATLNSTGIASFANAGLLTETGKTSAVTIGGGWSDTGSIAVSGGANMTLQGTFVTGGGTISATDAGSIVHVAGNFTQTGQVNVANGAIVSLSGNLTSTELAAVNSTGGTVQFSGVLANTGTFVASAGLNLGIGTIQGGTVVDSAGILNTIGGTLSGVSYDGTLNATSSSAFLSLTGTNSFAGANGTGLGTINDTGSSGTLALRDVSMVDNAILNIGSAANYAVLAIQTDTSTVATATLGSNLTIDQAATYARIYVGAYDGVALGGLLVDKGTIDAAINGGQLQIIQGETGSFVNQGAIDIGNGDTVSVSTSSFSNQGSVVAGAGSFFALGANTSFANLSGNTLTGGSLEADAGSTITLETGITIATLNASVTLSGAGSSLQWLNNASHTVQLDTSLSNIGTAGALHLLAGRNLSTTGTLTDAGLLQLGGGKLAPGALAVTGTGRLSGFGTVAVPLANAGTLEAAGGTLLLSGAVTGTGALQVDAGATLELAGTTPASQTLTFAGQGGTLKLDAATGFASPLAGYGAGDAVNLGTLAATTASITGTLLSIALSGGGSLTETLTAPNAADRIGVSSDGHTLTAFRLATAGTHTPEPLAFGNHHVGDTASQALTLTNTAAADGYSEKLDASFGPVTNGLTSAGSITALVAGQTDSTSLTVGLNTSASGSVTGTAAILLSSDGTGTDGLAATAIGTQTVNVTGAVYAYAAPVLANGGTLVLANVHAGAAETGALSLTNAATANGFAEALDASLGGASAGLSATGSLAGLAAGATDASSLQLGFATTSAGAYSGTATLSLTSDGTGIDGLGTTALPGQTVVVTGAAYAYAAGALASSTLNLGVVHVGSTAQQALSLSNTAQAGGYTEALDAGFGATTGAATASGTVTGLAGGGTNTAALLVGLATSTSGTQSGTAVLGLVSDGTGIDGLGTTALAGQTITVTGIVDNYAVAAFQDVSGPAITGSGTAYTLNLGSIGQNTAALTETLGVLNAAGGLADLLGGTVTTAGGAAFTNTGFGTFAGLAAGQGEHAQTVTLSTGTAGTFTEQLVLTSAGSNAGGYTGALPTETLTISGTVVASGVTTYVLAAGPNVISGANGGDLFQAVAGSLNSRDQLTGGNGANVLALQGGGVFDLGAPKVFANIPTVTAQEGQAAGKSAPDTRQTIYLRDGSNETLSVAAGTPAAGNNNPEAITIYGGTGTDSLTLAAGQDSVLLYTGTDTVVLGGAANSVAGGGGTALVQGAAAMASAAVVGTSAGTTTLEITTAGTATLNAADTYLTVKLDGATKLTLGGMGFITANGGNGTDTITAGAGNQTLVGGAGDVLNGYASGGDTFLGASAALNADTIGRWATGDVVDLTDMNSATLQALAYKPGKTSGVLTVKDGTHTAAITFTGSFASTNFTVIGSDGHGGTLIGYHG